MAKILIAISGGVDSSVAAHILKEQGHELHGVYLRTWINDEDIFAECPADEDIKYAEAVCQQLGISFEVISLVEEYQQKVVDYLVDGYRRGITPNPDIMCNREMKFGVLREIAIERGFDGLATGHYTRITNSEQKNVQVLEGVDPQKDQSYFLAMVRKEQFEHAYFPIGDFQKSEIREYAKRLDLPNAKRKDSQGICFLGKVNINNFLANFIEEKPGRIINHDGKVVGKHKGLHHYTIGQRRGIGVPSNTDNEAYVVVGKDMKRNVLLVAFDRPESKGLYAKRALIGDLNVLDKLISGEPLLAKVRYRDDKVALDWQWQGDCLEIHFHEAQRALALGQVLALYRGPQLLGGGFYREID